jgi:hypothetical protein
MPRICALGHSSGPLRSVQANIKGLRSLFEPLQVAMDNGAKRALIPIENKRNLLEVTGDVMEHVDRSSSVIPRLRRLDQLFMLHSGQTRATDTISSRPVLYTATVCRGFVAVGLPIPNTRVFC